MILELLEAALATFVALLPIANPFSTAVVFLAITRRFDPARQQQQAWLACVYMVAVLLTFLFAGAVIMRFFGISLPAVRIAGGLIVARIGFGMLAPRSGADADAADPTIDVAFTPLAVPMLSGPGSIAVTISMAAGVDGWFDYAGIVLGIAAVAALSYALLRGARGVASLLGSSGLDALTRIMGFLLVCVGVQFIGLAVQQLLSSAQFMQPILDTIGR